MNNPRYSQIEADDAIHQELLINDKCFAELNKLQTRRGKKEVEANCILSNRQKDGLKKTKMGHR